MEVLNIIIGFSGHMERNITDHASCHHLFPDKPLSQCYIFLIRKLILESHIKAVGKLCFRMLFYRLQLVPEGRAILKPFRHIIRQQNPRFDHSALLRIILSLAVIIVVDFLSGTVCCCGNCGVTFTASDLCDMKVIQRHHAPPSRATVLSPALPPFSFGIPFSVSFFFALSVITRSACSFTAFENAI